VSRRRGDSGRPNGSAPTGLDSEYNAGERCRLRVNQTHVGSLSLRLQKSLEDPGICSGQIHLVRSALDRMASGVYGRCLKCYREIGLVRLTALPHASFCVPCQEHAYRRSESIRVGSRRFSEEGDDDV
jgi:hypothetical protein